MKTKLIILAAAGSAIVFSCTNNRDEDEIINPAPNSKVIELKKLKTNKDNNGSTAKVGDSTIIIPHPQELNSDGNTIQPTDPDPVVDPTKPDKPW